MKPLHKLDTATPSALVQHRHKKALPGAYQNDSQTVYVASSKNYLFIKRFSDVTISVVVIAGILSWVLPLIGILIKLDSKGPVFFKQKRVGRNGKPFMCLKLRTMIANAEADEVPARENDHRITNLGLFLRRTHLDELPQFFNVLIGAMSIVGPRPHMIADCVRFSFVIPSYSFRHSVKPGITGWAQTKGYHGPTANYESIINRYYWDSQYVHNAGAWLDIKILLRTIAKIIHQIL